MTTENFKKYAKTVKIDAQFARLLRAMAAEMSSVSDAPDLRDFFFRIGEQFATAAGEAFENVESLEDLESCLNAFWAEMSWGWVELNEEDEGINISHQCAPLAQAFGDDSLAWSVGLLEGFYQTLFTEFGASDDMTMNCISASQDGMDIRLRFSQS